jgi:hypothetical protein
MPGYVRKALKQFQHILRKKQNQPFPHNPIKYGAKKQYATEASKAHQQLKKRKSSFNKSAASFYFMDVL